MPKQIYFQGRFIDQPEPTAVVPVVPAVSIARFWAPSQTPVEKDIAHIVKRLERLETPDE